MPGARLGIVKLPTSLLTATLVVWVASLCTVIFALRTTAPDASEMVPDREEVSVWARIEVTVVNRQTITIKTARILNL